MAERVASRAPPAMVCLLLFFSVIHRILPVAEAIWLTIPSSGTKCVSEEIHNNVVVLADYVLINAHGDGGAATAGDSHGQPQIATTISAKVTSPYGNSLHHQENVTHGQFAFTTKEGGNYLACFWLEGHHKEGTEPSLSLDWKTGITAKDWESVARKEKVEGVELELAKLEGLVEAIHENLIYLKDREAEMREVSEKTNSRVAWFSIMALGISILAAALQTWHLQGFFQKKKLI